MPSAVRRAAIVSLVKSASKLPRGVAEQVFGGAGVLGALAEPQRVAMAYAWATAHESPAAPRWRTMLSVLAHRGRMFTDHWAPVFERPADLKRRTRVDGREHLDAAAGRPTILLSFHLGTPITRWALRTHGYDSIVAGDGLWHFASHAAAKPGWSSEEAAGWTPVELNEQVGFSEEQSDESQRAVVMIRLRAMLKAGQTVRMLADGRNGRELFRIPAGGRALIVRAGWWRLRADTDAIVLPVLAHRHGSATVVTVSPPLPERTADADSDLASCRDRLTSLVQNFVKRYPGQCLPWRFDSVGQ